MGGKIVTIDQLAKILNKQRLKNKKIVHCHGAFDLLHPGHIRHLEAAKKEGDILVVTITSDNFIRKGPGRPVFTHRLRAESLAALSCVDYVAIVYAPTAIEVIKKLKPNLYVKGQEYSRRNEDLTGKIYDEEHAVRSVGGSLHFTEDITFSSTSLLNVHFKVFPESATDFLNKFKKSHSSDSIIAKLKELKSLKVLVIGDTIIDEYRYCSGLGKPQKDNIIATRYLYEERFAGGVLAIANHVAGFCKQVRLVSLLGGRNNYRQFIDTKLKPQVKARFFVQKDILTVVKRRFLDPSFLGKMFELYFIDDFVLNEKVEKNIIEYLKKVVKEYDVVIVGDFGHGFITNRIITLLSKKARFLAVNTQTNSANMGFNLITKYPRADYISIDEPELRLAMHDKVSPLKNLVSNLYQSMHPRKVTITRGHRGALTYSPEGGFAHTPVFSEKIVDRIGAGDACLSITSLAAAAGFSDKEIGFICNAVGALAVLIVGNRESVDPVTLYKFIVTLLK